MLEVPSALPQLDLRQSLVDAIHIVLRDGITDGTLASGSRLREVNIARYFDVSPTPVREALRRLERDGLVVSHPNRGASVAEVSPSDLENLYEIHEVLEMYAVRKTTERSGVDIPSLNALLDEIDLSVPFPTQTAFNRIDLKFHRALNNLSGNAALAETIEVTHRRIQSARVRFDIHLPDRPHRSQVQHRDIVAAVAAGDADLAAARAGDHIRSIREPVIAMLRASLQGQEVTIIKSQD